MQFCVSPPAFAQPQHLRARRLRAHQHRGEVGGVRERVADAAEHLRTHLADDLRGVALQRLAECIVGGDEEPAIAAFLDDGAAGRFAEHVGVVGPVDRVRAALRTGQVGRAGAGIQHHLVLLATHGVDRETDGRGRHIDDGIDAVLIEPLPRDRGADIGLVLVIGRNDLDVEPLAGDAEIHQCLPGADHACGSAIVTVLSGLIVEHADTDGRRLRTDQAWSGGNGGGGKHGAARQTHCSGPLGIEGARTKAVPYPFPGLGTREGRSQAYYTVTDGGLDGRRQDGNYGRD